MATKLKIFPESPSDFRLPKSLEVGGITITVIEDPNLYETHGAYGMMDMDRGKLLIEKSLVGDTRAITYHHELVHMILNTLGRTELNEDEAFVDSVANLLWQANKTARH